MVDILLEGYEPTYDQELEYVKSQKENAAMLKIHLNKQRELQEKFLKIYKLEVMLLKFIPLFTLIIFLIGSSYYRVIFAVAILLAFLIEGVVVSYFPRDHYRRYVKNSAILESAIAILKNR